MDTEIENFAKIWGVAIASSIYAHYLSRIPKGIPRLVFLLPVIFLFTLLPFSLTSVHLTSITVGFLVWLANFKLLLYSFDLGPLSTKPNTSLPRFVAIALLPIKDKDNGALSPNKKITLGGSLVFGVKLVAFALVVKIYESEYRRDLPQYVLLVSQGCYLYIVVEATLAVTAALVRATLGLDSDTQFNEPYLATSLQDFWGRRWNLMISNILRLSVHGPVRHVVSPLVGRKWGFIIAGLATFTVSGLMHELMYFYVLRVSPTWEVTCFFVVQGLCTMGEIMVKEGFIGQRFKLHRLISGPLTIGFVAITGWWLFLPQLVRNGVDVRALNECITVVRSVTGHVVSLM